eukprot:TRINITY_DN763_c0_g2_i1.p4 TRINITY_DN763_c0_g2~~TRINITY_DN763_c0_g2_i1.p4  ORF type:complete len:106 (-),score=1.88 TRINITY_DN763_c0_g2_i1:238-555(-)
MLGVVARNFIVLAIFLLLSNIFNIFIVWISSYQYNYYCCYYYQQQQYLELYKKYYFNCFNCLLSALGQREMFRLDFSPLFFKVLIKNLQNYNSSFIYLFFNYDFY